MQKIYSDNLSFNGYFQGFLSKGKGLHKYPEEKVKACFYSDNLALKLFTKALKTNSNEFKINLIDKDTIIFEADRIQIKHLIPRIIRFLKGNGNDLSDKVFWKMLNNKDIKKIQYEIKPEDITKIFL